MYKKRKYLKLSDLVPSENHCFVEPTGAAVPFQRKLKPQIARAVSILRLLRPFPWNTKRAPEVAQLALELERIGL